MHIYGSIVGAATYCMCSWGSALVLSVAIIYDRGPVGRAPDHVTYNHSGHMSWSATSWCSDLLKWSPGGISKGLTYS